MNKKDLLKKQLSEKIIAIKNKRAEDKKNQEKKEVVESIKSLPAALTALKEELAKSSKDYERVTALIEVVKEFALKNNEGGVLVAEALAAIVKGGVAITNFPEQKEFPEFPKSMEVTMHKPEWYEAPKEMPEEIGIRGVVEVKADNTGLVSGIAAISTAFLSSLVSFLGMLANKVFSVQLNAEHYTTPQKTVLVDPNSFKPVDLAEILNIKVISQGGSGGSSAALENAINDSLDNYKISDGDETGTTKYYGYISKTGRWYIMQNDTTANTYRYASGATAYTTNWTNRAALTYGYFNSIFA